MLSLSPSHFSPVQDYLRDPLGAFQRAVMHLRELVLTWGPVVGPALVITLTGLILARRRWQRRYHQRLMSDARLITVLAPPTVDPSGALTLWSNLVGLLRPGWLRRFSGQPHLAFELTFTADGVQIQFWVPGLVPPGMVERAIEAAWPGAHTRTSPAKSIPDVAAGRKAEAVGGELRLARAEALPIRTEHPVDPIRALLGAPVGLGPHEKACVQVLARPVAGHRVAKARRAARRVHAGGSPHLIGRLLDLVTPGKTPKSSPRTRIHGLDRQAGLEYAAQDRAVVEKLRANQFETRIRYAVTTTVPDNATAGEVQAAREVLRGRGHAIASAFAAYSEHNYYRRARLRRPAAALADRRFGKGDLLSIRELAALAHLPIDEATPGLQRAGAKAVPPPPGIADVGEHIKPIGRSDSGHSRPVGLHVADAAHHVHLLGATGSGKSELMAQMILADAEAGRGVVVIDPKGDLVSDILMRLPEELGEKVVLFDADSKTRPPVLNPLDGRDKVRAVDNLVSIFSRIYASSWGPRTEDILRASLLTLTAMPGTPTLVDLPKLLTVQAFRQRARDHIDDEVLKGFWTWYDDLSEANRAQVIAPLMNKVRGFLLRPFVRAAIAGGESTVDMDDVLNNGGICLVRIARDALGTETAQLVGSIVVARTWQAATRRANIPKRQRRHCGLYIDECHNFLNLPYPAEDMLAEARAYKLSTSLAHQYMNQLTKELEEGISTNARSKIYFNVSPEDARRLARHTMPRLSEHDLSNLGVYHVAARLVVGGEETPAFTAVTEKLRPAIPGRAKAIRKAARVNTRPPMSDAVEPKSSTVDPRRAA
ncbi:type IV secretion system coupling TraD/TrwB family protein [Lentzea flaviverrucosa]|uniref:Type IV secretion-system coupling protein DNA-binding domain-containing protein n=2 Tax=Lentzea flaviverrucosa TaxID=200379 RepID=A0A1H9SM45_9PSEU|nr:type IV secretion system coupling TraD/TrwB family protein [Lentzea flaviverrucosa]SER86090.1 Type IV secretion-system coupling protein DNA-binding domain-containing protein [Lentzea flaviverrucosa]